MLPSLADMPWLSSCIQCQAAHKYASTASVPGVRVHYCITAYYWGCGAEAWNPPLRVARTPSWPNSGRIYTLLYSFEIDMSHKSVAARCMFLPFPSSQSRGMQARCVCARPCMFTKFCSTPTRKETKEEAYLQDDAGSAESITKLMPAVLWCSTEG